MKSIEIKNMRDTRTVAAPARTVAISMAAKRVMKMIHVSWIVLPIKMVD